MARKAPAAMPIIGTGRRAQNEAKPHRPNTQRRLNADIAAGLKMRRRYGVASTAARHPITTHR